MLSNLLFGASSEFREKMRKEKLLTGLYKEWESIEGFKTFYLMANSTEVDKLEKEILDVFKNMNIDENSFNRTKKVWTSREIKAIDNIDYTVDKIYSDVLNYKKVINNRLDMIKNMKFKVLKDLIKKIDFTNISVVKMDKNK